MRTVRRRVLLALLGWALICTAQEGRWEYLGEANVDGAVDHDSIAATAARGEFRAIQIRVEKGPILFDRVLVHYGNGRTEPISIRERIPAGGRTRVIDLPGNERIIRRVEFWYERGNWRIRPTVRLWGLH
jgi:hypothetical protein